MRLSKKLHAKKLVVFDLDGTLTETKSKMDPEMSRLLTELLKRKIVAVIGGGKYGIFKTHFIAVLKCPRELLKNLFLFPATATTFYRYRNGWKKVYALELSRRERVKIKNAFKEVFRDIHYVPPRKVYGKVIEDRRTQVTFSALGQDVVARLGEKEGVRLKKKWKKERTATKLKIARILQKRLPKLEVRAAGYTSVDVTRKGVDKAYGIRQIEKYLKVPRKDVLFVGDALFRGGNDYAARRTGVQCIQVSGPREAKKLIRRLLSLFIS